MDQRLAVCLHICFPLQVQSMVVAEQQFTGDVGDDLVDRLNDHVVIAQACRQRSTATPRWTTYRSCHQLLWTLVISQPASIITVNIILHCLNSSKDKMWPYSRCLQPISILMYISIKCTRTHRCCYNSPQHCCHYYYNQYHYHQILHLPTYTTAHFKSSFRCKIIIFKIWKIQSNFRGCILVTHVR